MGGRSFQKVQAIDDRIIIWVTMHFAERRWQSLMAFLSHPPHWRPVLGTILAVALLLGNPAFRIQLLWLTLAIFLSDQTCNLIKAIVKRVRPDGLRNTSGSIWRRIGYYSFPSSHAANTFNFAILSFQWLGYWNTPLLLIAVLVSFSRVARQNHYPSDVVVGALIGIAYGCLFLWIK
jgi:undecaprenyl-diphosphatase